MRLDFNVLWVDDQPDRVAAQIRAISNRMEMEGFNFNPTLAKTMSEVRDEISESVFADEVDLVLVDWDLGSGVQGQDAIVAIRDSIQYKDVVFYSAQTVPEELRRFVFENGLEGIYCASRKELVDEVMGVFDSLVKKVLDLDHMRGIVMGATSDIDFMVSKILLNLQGRVDQMGKATIIKNALRYTRDRATDLNERVKKLEDATSLEDFFASHMILTANDRLRLLTGVLKGAGLEPYRGYRAAAIDYMRNIVPSRNRLGHMVLEREGKPQALTDNRGEAISVDETRELRRRILDLRSKFRELLRELSS